MRLCIPRCRLGGETETSASYNHYNYQLLEYFVMITITITNWMLSQICNDCYNYFFNYDIFFDHNITNLQVCFLLPAVASARQLLPQLLPITTKSITITNYTCSIPNVPLQLRWQLHKIMVINYNYHSTTLMVMHV